MVLSRVASSGSVCSHSLRLTTVLVFLSLLISACFPTPTPPDFSGGEFSEDDFWDELGLLPLPTRTAYAPGELVEYTAQSGDTLPALAKRFNTSIKEIRYANPIIPEEVTTLPHGLPMEIPIYYQPLWGSPFQVLPDSRFINGSAQQEFDPVVFVNEQPGWFKNYQHNAGGKERRGGELILHVATNFSISPRLLLALLEYQTGSLTQSIQPESDDQYPMGYANLAHRGLYRQLVWAANELNNGYYGWRTGRMTEFEHRDGRLERPDPWQNVGTVGIHYYFAQVLSADEYLHATSSEGLIKTYTELFGDPWENVQPHIPGSLQQPEMTLPFLPGRSWAFTGGPHTGWGKGDPLAALDFAPPAIQTGCVPTSEWVTAVTDGVIARTSEAIAVLDLDGDGDERTGWVVFYLHLESASLPRQGAFLKAGDPIGRPSCEGGSSTGTHVHIARKYNGEWIPADGVLAFNLEGWIARNGNAEYEGYLERFGHQVRACVCSDAASQIYSTTGVGR